MKKLFYLLLLVAASGLQAAAPKTAAKSVPKEYFGTFVETETYVPGAQAPGLQPSEVIEALRAKSILIGLLSSQLKEPQNAPVADQIAEALKKATSEYALLSAGFKKSVPAAANK